MQDTKESRYKFDSLLLEMGFNPINYSIMFDPTEEELEYQCDEGSISINVKIRPFIDKMNYLYFDFLNRHYNILPDEITKKKITKFLEKTYFQPQTNDIQICEVGWYLSGYTKPPEQFSVKNRKRMLFKIFNDIKFDLAKGVWMIYPRPNMILTAYPYGKKLNVEDDTLSFKKGKDNRMYFAKRLGFGEIQEDGMMYAKYDDTLTLKPL